MNNLNLRRLFLFAFFLSMAIGTCNAQLLHKNSSRKAEKRLYGKSSGRKREPKVKEPRTVLKAKKEQEANEKKLKKDYAKSVKRSQKRAIDIQTPEVQKRMKQNRKESSTRYKERKKKVKSGMKKAGKKYN